MNRWATLAKSLSGLPRPKFPSHRIREESSLATDFQSLHYSHYVSSPCMALDCNIADTDAHSPQWSAVRLPRARGRGPIRSNSP